MSHSALHGTAAALATAQRSEGPARRLEESFAVAIVLSIVGGYLDAFTWIAHDGVMANAQTANVVLLGVHAAMGQTGKALHHIPPIVAFVIGVFVVCRLRARIRDPNGRRLALLCLSVEIVVLGIVLTLHRSVPDVAGTLGISFAAALQTASFARLKGGAYSSVMLTGNLRSMTEAFSGWLDKRDPAAFRPVRALTAVCVAFAVGAGLGAGVAHFFEDEALAIPILLLVGALLMCAPPRVRDKPVSERALAEE